MKQRVLQLRKRNVVPGALLTQGSPGFQAEPEKDQQLLIFFHL
jgi:hypothetical protein